MATAMQDKGRGPIAAERSRHEAHYDLLRIALEDARDAFDPHCAALEQRAATAPLIWYIEDTPDMALPRPRPGRDAPAP